MRKAVWAILFALMMVVTPMASSQDSLSDTWHTVPAQPVDPSLQEQAQAEAYKEVQKVDGLELQDYQLRNLLLGKSVAFQMFQGNSSVYPTAAHEFSLLVMSIMWQETKAGKFGPVGDIKNPFGLRSYGLMQVKLKTAKKMLSLHRELYSFFGNVEPADVTDEEVIAALIYNPELNIRLACAYLNYLHTTYKISWDKVITAYNRGYEGAKSTHFKKKSYTKNVMKHQQDQDMKNIASGR